MLLIASSGGDACEMLSRSCVCAWDGWLPPLPLLPLLLLLLPYPNQQALTGMATPTFLPHAPE